MQNPRSCLLRGRCCSFTGDADRRGLPALHDEIALDNPAIALFLRCGFREISRSAQAVLLRRDLHP